MKIKIIKGLLPILSYLIFVSFLSFMSVLEESVYGFGMKTGPTVLSDSLLILKLLPVIAWGYILLIVVQWIYARQKRGAVLFAWGITIVSIFLFVWKEFYQVANWNHFVVFILIPLAFYYLVFFGSLFYVLKKESNYAVPYSYKLSKMETL